MKILFITSNSALFSLDSGGAMRNNLFVGALSQIGHVDVISFNQKDLVSNVNNCNVIYSEFVEEEHSRWELLRTWLAMTIKPTDPYSYYKVNKKRAEIVNHFVQDSHYDLIACRYIDTATSCGLWKYGDRLVIDMDDHPVNKLKFLLPLVKFPVVKWKKLYEIKRMRKMVEKKLDSVACSFYSNMMEKPSSKSIYLHNTITFDEAVADVNATMNPVILYVGSFYHLPSKYGIFHFTNNIFPLIKERIPNAKLRIVGKGEKEWIDSLNKEDGVEAVGFVEDLVSEYKKARVVVVPIYQGTGTCVKFVEGLMMNRPVVSTPVGVRGFEEICKDGRHFMLAKSDEEFAEKTVELLSSLTTSQTIAKAGYEIAKKNFSQERFYEIVIEALSRVTTFLT